MNQLKILMVFIIYFGLQTQIISMQSLQIENECNLIATIYNYSLKKNPTPYNLHLVNN